jgi:hypothetical protein
MNLLRADLKGLGFKMKDVNAAVRYHELEPEDRHEALQTFLTVCAALEIDLDVDKQLDLFGDAGAGDDAVLN